MCVRVARFELAIRARTDLTLWERPAAIASQQTARGTLRLITPGAERLGLFVGQSVADALALCPALELFPPDEKLVQDTRAHLLARLLALSPSLDADSQGAFFLGLGGLGRLHPDEFSFAQAARAVLGKEGFGSRVGIADRSLAAWTAARRARPVLLVAPGEDAQALADVPLSELGLSERTLGRLGLWGLKTLGHIQAMPPGALASRLPGEGEQLERLSRGEAEVASPRGGLVAGDPEEVSLDLEPPTDALEPLLFLFKSRLDALFERLVRTGKALATLLIVLGLDDKSEVRHAITPARPTSNSQTLMELVRLWLSQAPLPEAVASMRLVAWRVESPPGRQAGLLTQRRERMEEALSQAVARLGSAFGPENVRRPVLVDTYRPERRVLWKPFAEPQKTPVRAHSASPDAPSAALRLFDPPLPALWQGQKLHPDGKPPVLIRHLDGPHRLSGEWWDVPFKRLYYWVTGANGERLWVYQDEPCGTLFIQAEAD